MLPIEIYNKLICGLSFDKHFVKEPLLLESCGHYICKTCLNKTNNEVISCKICHKKTKRDVISDEEYTEATKSLEKNIGSFLEIIENKIRQSIEQITTKLSSNKDKIQISIQYYKEEIEIRIESLKNELDELHEKFNEKLCKMENDLINDYKLIETHANNDIQNIEMKLGQLNDNFENQMTQNLYESQNDLNKLKHLMDKIDFETYQITFKPSDLSINEELVGKLTWHNKKFINIQEINERLKSETFVKVNLDTEPNDICILPNDELALANSSEKIITVFDKNFNLLKTIDKIDGKIYKPLRLATNNKDRIYITNYKDYEIIMTDLSFNKIKSFGSTSGDGINQFDYCNGISFFENKLYICDTNNKRIQVFSNDLEYERTITLEYQPWIIKISPERVVCITQFDKAGICFYDFDTFTLKCKYNDHGYGRLSEINSFFIESCSTNSTIHIYNKDGSLYDSIKNEIFDNFIENAGDGILTYFNGDLLVSSIQDKQILKF